MENNELYYTIFGFDVKIGDFSSSAGKLSVFHIFAQWVPGTQDKKIYQHLWYQLKVTIKGVNVNT